MNIIQFFRILWAYRLLTVLTTAATLIGALVAVLIIPPSYEAKTRVMLNTLKPDPVTGESMVGNAARTYMATQRELIQDVGVAGQAVDQLGWLSDPETLQNYNATGSQDVDLRRVLAQRIVDRTRVEMIPATNILEIVFRAPTPADARTMANALRDAYIEPTLNSRRREANRNAGWFQTQAEKERVLLDRAEQAKTSYERENHIVMQDEKTDVETARLRALATQAGVGPVMTTPVIPQSSPAAIQLAQLDAQIAQASKTLGPNHPQMIQLKAQRATLAKVVAQDEAAAHNAASAAAAAAAQSASAMSSAVAQQTSKVIANRDKIEKLSQLQAEVNLHRAQMEKALARASELRQESAVADSGIAVLSEAITPRAPAFPNKPLIFGGALGIGAAIGLFLSLLIELFRRRVRGVEDLQHGTHVPLLAVISTPGQPGEARTFASTAKALLPRRRRAATA
jgi:uncharacterized protein involved in exopolysaccharide biosynthesis